MQGELVIGGVKESFDGLGSEVPVNSSESREAAVRSASAVSMLRLLQVGVVTMLSLLVRRGRRGGGRDG